MTHVHFLTKEARERGLRDAGYSATIDSALAALHDSRPNVRSLAAQQLASMPQPASVEPLLKAESSETDACAGAVMRLELNTLVGERLVNWDFQVHQNVA